MFGKIKITDFGKRHFDTKFGGTKITNKTPEEFEAYINEQIKLYDENPGLLEGNVMEGYAPFCKLIAIKNFTNAKVGTMPITNENFIYIRHGYSSRTPEELPVLSRYFMLPLPAPVADYLIVIVYSKEQVEKEANDSLPSAGQGVMTSPFVFDADWGVVAILGQTHPNEEPMAPITMMRNALGTKEGGSGVPINRDKYQASVEFWEKHAIVKS